MLNYSCTFQLFRNKLNINLNYLERPKKKKKKVPASVVNNNHAASQLVQIWSDLLKIVWNIKKIEKYFYLEINSTFVILIIWKGQKTKMFQLM